MTANDRFERELEGWLVAEAPRQAPLGLHDLVIDRARAARQRPPWLAALRIGTVGGSLAALGRPAVRVAYLLVIAGLILAILIAAIAVGAFRPRPLELGRDGPIAYSVKDLLQRGEPSVVHLIDPDGTDRAIAFGSCPTFSRDGSALAYVTGYLGATDLHIARPDGSESRFVLHVGEAEYALSPDGTRIAWFKDEPVMAPDAGGGLSTVGLTTELWVTPVSGGPGVRIVPASTRPNEWYRLPVWSPDGQQIAFASNVRVSSPDYADDYRAAIYLVNADGSSLHQLSARPGTVDIGLSWSPDGRSIAYLGLPDGSSVPTVDAPGDLEASLRQPPDVFVINTDGTGERNLTNSAASEHEPEWSPDGTRLAYEQIDANGVTHLAIVRMDGSTQAGSPILGPGDSLSWSPDGRHLLAGGNVQDADFREPATSLQIATDDRPQCAPSWDRLAP